MDMFTAISRQTPIKVLSVAEEQHLIAAAQDGDKPAAQQLIANYLPLMKRLIGHEITHIHTTQRVNVESDDWQSAAIDGFYEALHLFDDAKHIRLAQVIGFPVRRHLSDARLGGMVVQVPARTRSNFSNILAAAGGDYAKAYDLAPQMGMDRHTFRAIAEAYALGTFPDRPGDEKDHSDPNDRSAGEGNGRSGGFGAVADIDGARVISGAREPIRVEDLIDADRALNALDPTSRLVIEALFGVGDQPQLSQRDAAEALGMTRTTLQRKAASALVVMRATLGA